MSRAGLLLGLLVIVGMVASLCTPDLALPREARRWHGPLADQMYACNKPPAKWTRKELECVVETRFAPLGEAENAKRIVTCESQWNPRAVSRTDDHGLFQINRRWNATAWKRGESIYDPVWNTLSAARFLDERGWDDWTCARILGID